VYKIEAEITLSTCDNKALSKQIIVAKNLNTLTEEKLTTDEKGKVTFKPALNSRYQFSYAGEGNIASCTTEKTFDKEGKHTVKLSSNYSNKQVNITVVDENQVSLSGAQLTYYSKGRATKKRITDGNNPIIVLSTEELAETDSIVGNLINYTDGKLSWSSTSECNSTQNLSMVLSPIKGRDRINLGMIYYDFDLWNLRPESKVELDKLVKYMKEHPDLTVELGSHTDSRGSDYYNEWLSEQRSQSCINYIKKNGIPVNKIIAKGYGEKQLVNSCSDGVKCSEAEHQLNRRTTLEIKLD
jgi:outer membrane protein OmpA-like peptidoglycan-associated protein